MLMEKIKVGIIGGAGYTGGELIRLLVNHTYTEISFIHSRSHSNAAIGSVHADLVDDTDLLFVGSIPKDWNHVDVLFLCVGHGEAKKFLEEHQPPGNINIIDLSQDFRLVQNNNLTATYSNREFVYGLPELNKEKITKAKNIANPGCFATAIQLGLLPLAKEDLLGEIQTTGITGSTGAGQSLNATSHFSWRANNIQAYKSLTHQHIKEIHQSLHHLQNSFPLQTQGEAIKEKGLHFIPWRGDFTRGIFISSMVACDLSIQELNVIYKDFYKDEPFVSISDQPIFLKQVVNTNKCVIQLEKVGSKLVVHSAIDNLLKGASGQAVQNMNLMFGIDECAGLKLKASNF
jgi:N-acetyl-gamma-glutamyl-phosphate reductase